VDKSLDKTYFRSSGALFAVTTPQRDESPGLVSRAAPKLFSGIAGLLPRRIGSSGAVAAPNLRSLARQIRTAGRPGAAVNQRTVAVGEDAGGNLFAGSSGSFDAGQRAMADSLGIIRVPSRTLAGKALHAEENLLAAKPDMVRIGTDVRMPCGPLEHDCAAQLGNMGVVIEP
jgi:hypothetical protein